MGRSDRMRRKGPEYMVTHAVRDFFGSLRRLLVNQNAASDHEKRVPVGKHSFRLLCEMEDVKVRQGANSFRMPEYSDHFQRACIQKVVEIVMHWFQNSQISYSRHLTTMTQPGGPQSKVFSKCYVFDPRPNIPFQISVKRYWTISDTDQCSRANTSLGLEDNKAKADLLPVTLIFTHSNGGHKEWWEPTIHRLFEQQRVNGELLRFQDMWSIDAPNQGDSAVLNEEVLAWGYNTFSWEDYGRCVHAFLTGLGSGVDVDFSRRNLAAVGHSVGTVALVLSTTFSPLIKFSSVHLIEPPILGKYAEGHAWHLERLMLGRKDVWDNADEVYETFKRGPKMQHWDDRVVRIHAEYGVRPLPTLEYPDQKSGVTLKCTRKQEAGTFRERRSTAVASRYLSHMLKRIPTHILWGEIPNIFIPEIQNYVLHELSGGITNWASVTRVPGVGHQMIQTHPDLTADTIWNTLLKTHLRGRIHNVVVVAKL